jgi:hypothetical protein
MLWAAYYYLGWMGKNIDAIKYMAEKAWEGDER